MSYARASVLPAWISTAARMPAAAYRCLRSARMGFGCGTNARHRILLSAVCPRRFRLHGRLMNGLCAIISHHALPHIMCCRTVRAKCCRAAQRPVRSTMFAERVIAKHSLRRSCAHVAFAVRILHKTSAFLLMAATMPARGLTARPAGVILTYGDVL